MSQNNELYHYGVLGMKWGHRKAIPTKMSVNKSDSKTTQKVKNDYNKLSDKDFKRRYRTSKKTYAKRVEKYGDPYKHRINSKLYKHVKNKYGTKEYENYKENTKKNNKTWLKGAAAEAVGGALYAIGGLTYLKNRNNGTPLAAAIVNGSVMAGTALAAIGEISMSSATIKQYQNRRKWKKSYKGKK